MQPIHSATILQIIDAVAIVLGQAYQLARARLASSGSPVLRMAVQRDHTLTDAELLRRELDIFRGQRESFPPHRRPTYSGTHRFAIIQLMRLRGWTVKKTADRFVLHPNTVRSWIHAIEGKALPGVPGVGNLFGDVPWNKLHDAVRWAIHELRRLFPEPEFGTRTIANHLIRSGVQVCRTTIQRTLRESPSAPGSGAPRIRKAIDTERQGVDPFHLLNPKTCNRVWQLDLLQLRFLTFRFTIAAVIDGYSRRVLELKVYHGAPTSRHMIRLVRRTAIAYGLPRFIITDHGCQFRQGFRTAMKTLGITPVRGRVRSPLFNGKVERFFRTLRQWLRLALLPLTVRGIQARLDRYRAWFNLHRVNQAIGGLTPDEMANGSTPKAPIRFRAADDIDPHITVTRMCCRGDPTLPIVSIEVKLKAA